MASYLPVILCGGAGSRLWPASRESFPKQLFAFDGGRSLFQETLSRVSNAGTARPIIVTGHDYRFLVAEQARALGVEVDILLEPARRDSAAAIGAAAAHALSRDSDAILLVLAADHAIPDVAAFLDHVAEGAALAAKGRIVTFGITPSHAATGYGYIKPGLGIEGFARASSIAAFVEKPDLETAKHYLSEGYLWNSGNFMFQASVFMAELHRLAPDIAGPVQASIDQGARDLDFLRLAPEPFLNARATSVDYAVMEKTDRAAVIRSDFAWSDVGSWSAVWDLTQKDENGNGAAGDAVFEAAKNCYVYSPNLLTALVGVENVAVITTRDAVLVVSLDQAEAVKTLHGTLKQQGRKEALEHLRAYRPWGDYEQIDKGARYQVKRITVRPGGVLSLQSHVHRSEHWVVVSGTAKVTIDAKESLIHENEGVYIPLGSIHRLENPGRIKLELIEVQVGSYLGEDDITRYADIYNREK
jgi:mannose-1-phosphate guanylyltransferase / mannose-6-phosphate isomerase